MTRHPDTPEQSNELYRRRPLTWEEIGLRAWRLTDSDQPNEDVRPSERMRRA